MKYQWEGGIEREKETEKAIERMREVEEAEQRLLEAREAGHELARVSDAAVLEEEAEHLVPSEFGPEVKAEARLLQVERASEVQEEQRLNAAAERIRQIDWLKPKNWRRLNEYERRVALDRVGRELGKVYHHPTPPLIISEGEGKTLQAEYSDDDYWIFMNRAAEAGREQKLFGDDPVPALRTYAHEWRHSYQFEQATRWEKPQFWNLVDNPDQAMRWSFNIRDYKEPPDDELDKIDPARYKREYDAYRKQPVEEDAQRFADKLVRLIYTPS
jgi:hypothetical protein